jgi:FkbM family methyltransferase
MFKKKIKSILKKFGIHVSQYSPLQFEGNELNRLYASAPWIRLWLSLSVEDQELIMPFLTKSRSQLGQDLFALYVNRKRKDIDRRPYFIEVGASDGITFSNSYMLESELRWNGILVEPCRSWHRELVLNRTSKVETCAVYSESNLSLRFLDVKNSSGYRELSGLADHSYGDNRGSVRNYDADEYNVTTKTLDEVLHINKSPRFIDFLSIDTEGSEYQVLNSVDFSKYKFGSICVEHNYNHKVREKIHELMEKVGYERIFEFASAWDDWYIPADSNLKCKNRPCSTIE